MDAKNRPFLDLFGRHFSLSVSFLRAELVRLENSSRVAVDLMFVGVLL